MFTWGISDLEQIPVYVNHLDMISATYPLEYPNHVTEIKDWANLHNWIFGKLFREI